MFYSLREKRDFMILTKNVIWKRYQTKNIYFVILTDNVVLLILKENAFLQFWWKNINFAGFNGKKLKFLWLKL